MKYQIGKRIQELRKKKGITQEELGRICNVSTQAVSKWECGGTPDAELLPVIADYFHVSCDYLFARKDTMELDIRDRVAEALIAKSSREEQLKLAFELCYMIDLAVSKLPHTEVMPSYENILISQDKPELYFMVEYDDLISTMKLMKDFHYFLYLPEPEEGFKSVIEDAGTMSEFFQLLAKPHYLQLLYYLHEKQYSVSEQRIIRDLHLSQDEAKNIFDELCERQYLERMTIESDNGILEAYKGIGGSSFLKFLIFASEYMRSDAAVMAYAALDRKLPIISIHKEINS